MLSPDSAALSRATSPWLAFLAALPLQAAPPADRSLPRVWVEGQADVSPHRVGDRLDTEAARALMRRYQVRPRQPWREPSEADLPAGPEGERIREGIALMRHSSRYIGPHAPDPTRRINWINVNCANCHQAGPSGLPGTKPFALPLVNAANDYPKFDAKTGTVLSLTQRILGMFGSAPVPVTPERPEFQAILAYLHWLAQGSRPGEAMEGAGLGRLPPTVHAGDPVRGQALYRAQCQSCHGADLQGQRNTGFEQGAGYLFPPLAGNDTYDNAGHMFAVPLLARFIRATMPLGASWQAPRLSAEEALDLAAYVNGDATPRRRNMGRLRLYVNPALRPQGWAIPEHFTRENGTLDPDAYRRAKNGPFQNVNEEY